MMDRLARWIKMITRITAFFVGVDVVGRLRVRRQFVYFTQRRSFTFGLCVLSSIVMTQAMATAPPEAIGSLYLKPAHSYLCTASVVSGPELGLEPERVVLTAAHCLEPGLKKDSTTQNWSSKKAYAVSFDGQEFFDVQPYRIGFADTGYDLAILFFDNATPQVAPLHMGTWEAVDFGTPIQNFANPLGLGIQYFTGAVTMLHIDPSPVNAHRKQWFHNAVASLQVGPGSSGSLILNEDLEYVGVLSSVMEARFGSPFTIFIPQWRFEAFLLEAEAGRDLTCETCPAMNDVSLASSLGESTLVLR